MKQYHKIQTIYKRDEKTKRIIEGDFSMPEFEFLKDCPWVFTEKVDGTNIRVMWNGQDVTFGGKTDDAQMPVFLLYKLQELFEGTPNKQKLLEVFGVEGGVCLYGEGYGAKIQGAGKNYIPDGVSFVLFDVKVGDWWLQRSDVEDVAQKLGLQIVPIIGTGTLMEAVEMNRKGIKSQWGDFTAEGIVARPAIELFTRKGERIITKIKHRDF
jgi:ATP-dependent RNA circularization protein (DNA/RNA ligase family)